MHLPELRSAAKRIRDRDKPDLAAAKRLFDDARGQPEMVVASLVFMRHRGKLREKDWPDVARWAQGIESPEAADVFAQYVVAPLFERAPDEAQLERWAKSAEPLMRRLAARTAMHAGRLDALGTLARDEDALVQEAVAEALHEQAKKDETAVYDFLRAHPEAPRRRRAFARARARAHDGEAPAREGAPAAPQEGASAREGGGRADEGGARAQGAAREGADGARGRARAPGGRAARARGGGARGGEGEAAARRADVTTAPAPRAARPPRGRRPPR
ncbi:MAG TPA: DNA alkylation repair protein [Candidatus Thermoplasmatota archaeon]|nr:DNA alkylation repair protein [Candidatus Thermoplasmatota archaeon]